MKRQYSLWDILLIFLLLLCLGLILNGIFGSRPDEYLRPEGYFSMDPHMVPYQVDQDK